MDPAARPIIGLYELSHRMLTLAAGDLSDQDARTRSRGGTGPSIAWTIGHLCHHKVQVLELLGQPRQNPFAATFEGAATDGQAYPPLAELVASFSALNGEVCAALAAAGDRLDAPAPDAGPHGEKRLAETILFLAWHEAYHLGGIGAIRRDQGRTAIADLVRALQAA
jgi:uncharacterized damage-inducible protein DinB